MATTRKNPTRIALLVAGVMTLGTAGLAAAAPGNEGPVVRDHRASKGEAIKAKRAGKRAAKRAAKMARFDLDKDGVISASERTAMLRARFATLDLDNNGVITAPEMARAKAARRARMGKKAPNGKAHKGKRAGKQPRQAMTPAQRQQRMQERFARYDANNNGRVNFNEFVRARTIDKQNRKNRKDRKNRTK